MYIKLEQAKKHLILDEDFHDDDEYITDLIGVAEKAVEVNVDIALSELEDEGGQLPAPLIHAMLLLIGQLYANREPVVVGVSVSELPLSFRYLISLYKKWTVK